MRMYKVKLKGMGMGQYCPEGIWLTKDQLDKVMRRQYDENSRNNVVNFGGKYFTPASFETVLEEKELREVVENSPNCNSAFLESLAEDGYIDEVCKACRGTGWSGIAQNLLESGKYKSLGTGESKDTTNINQENIKRLQEMKAQYGLNNGNSQ